MNPDTSRFAVVLILALTLLGGFTVERTPAQTITEGARLAFEDPGYPRWILNPVEGERRFSWKPLMIPAFDGGFFASFDIVDGSEPVLLRGGRGGEVLWSRRLAWAPQREGYFHSITSMAERIGGGLFVAGLSKEVFGSGSRRWLLRISPPGEVLWTYGIDNRDDPVDLEATRDGGVILTGPVDHNESHLDGSVAKFSADGAVEWSHTIRRDAHGDPNGVLDLHEYLNSAEEAPDGTIHLVGTARSDVQRAGDYYNGAIWLVDLAADGVFMDAHLFYPSANDGAIGYGVAALDDGILIGATWGRDPSFFLDNGAILKIAPDRTPSWAHRIEGLEGEILGVQGTQDGPLMVLNVNPRLGAKDLLVASFSDSGEPRWTLQVDRAAVGYGLSGSAATTHLATVPFPGSLLLRDLGGLGQRSGSNLLLATFDPVGLKVHLMRLGLESDAGVTGCVRGGPAPITWTPFQVSHEVDTRVRLHDAGDFDYQISMRDFYSELVDVSLEMECLVPDPATSGRSPRRNWRTLVPMRVSYPEDPALDSRGLRRQSGETTTWFSGDPECRRCLPHLSPSFERERHTDHRSGVYAALQQFAPPPGIQADAGTVPRRELAKAIEGIPAGPAFTEGLRRHTLKALGSGPPRGSRPEPGAEPGIGETVAAAVHAMDADLALATVPALPLRTAGKGLLEFHGTAWLLPLRGSLSGASLDIRPGVPDDKTPFIPSWPALTWIVKGEGKMDSAGHLQVGIYIDGLQHFGPGDRVALYSWDGRSYRDVTIGYDREHGYILGELRSLESELVVGVLPAPEGCR